MPLTIDVDRYMSNKPASFWRKSRASMGAAVAMPPAQGDMEADHQTQVAAKGPAINPHTRYEQRRKSSVFDTQAGLFAMAAIGTAAGIAVGMPAWMGVGGLLYGAYRSWKQADEMFEYAKDRHDAHLFAGSHPGPGIARVPSVSERLSAFFRRPITQQISGAVGLAGRIVTSRPTRHQVLKTAGYATAIAGFGPGAILLAAMYETINWGTRAAEYVVYSAMTNDPKKAAINFNNRRNRNPVVE